MLDERWAAIVLEGKQWGTECPCCGDTGVTPHKYTKDDLLVDRGLQFNESGTHVLRLCTDCLVLYDWKD